MNRQPTRTLSAWYGVCLIGVLYVQPYGFFVAAAHWLSIVKWPLDCSSLFRRASVFMLLALISFAPWYLYASGTWAHSIHLVEGKYSFDFHSLLLIFRELVGMGYFGTAAILIGAFIGLRRRVDEGRTRFFWLCYLVIPIVGAATVDAAAGYFLAIRQMIFVLPPLSILFALGAESILERRRTVGASLAAAIFLGALYANWRFFHRPREDWQAASSTLMEERKHGACVFIAPADSAYLYTFFRPELTESQCDSTSLDGVQRVVVAVSSLDKEASLAAIENRLYASGFKKQNILRNREPQVSLFVRK